jgi:hypothetical protein
MAPIDKPLDDVALFGEVGPVVTGEDPLTPPDPDAGSDDELEEDFEVELEELWVRGLV